MGLFKKLFSSMRKPTLEHPLLGKMTLWHNGFWYVDKVEAFACPGNPELHIRGDVTGPKPECISTYQRLRMEWDTLKQPIAEEIFELNQNYFSAKPGQGLHSINSVWFTAEMEHITVETDGEFGVGWRCSV